MGNNPFKGLLHEQSSTTGKSKCSDGTAPCLKGTPDVKIDCKTVTIVFINTAAKQGKRPLATYSP